jgi:hypothetical protein
MNDDVYALEGEELDRPMTLWPDGPMFGDDRISSDQLLGVMLVERPSTAELEPDAAEQGRRMRAAEEERNARGAFTKAQPSVPVTHATIYGSSGLSLRAALRVIEDHGGSVTPGDHGTHQFALPALIHPDPLHDIELRRHVHEAIGTLDLCRDVVHALLIAERELPDLPPAAGGGVA